VRSLVLVEDHAPVRELYAAALRARGWHVIERASARGLKRLLREQAVEALVIDWTLPGPSGFDALAEVKRDPRLRHIRVLMLTAHHASTEKARALAAGAERFLEKPLHPDLLADALDHHA
jgi:two-component system phosphate regulon response regulator PhoB